MYALYLINRERDYLQSSREYSSQTAIEYSVLLRMIFTTVCAAGWLSPAEGAGSELLVVIIKHIQLGQHSSCDVSEKNIFFMCKTGHERERKEGVRRGSDQQ